MNHKTAIVTGGSSGIGKSTALALSAAGYTVYEFSRHAQPDGAVKHLTADVTDEASVQQAVAQVMEREGHIDLLVNNAGFGISGAVEFTTTAEAHHQFDVNFFGMVNLNRAVIPLMRAAGGGRIIHVSSVAAVAAIPFQAYYSAAKSAINTYSAALGNELYPFGISVCAVMPGDIATGFTAARQKSAAGDKVYGGRIARSVQGMERDEREGMSPDTAGRFIARIAQRKRIRPLYTIGFSYRAAVLLIRLLPCRAVQALLRQLYARG